MSIIDFLKEFYQLRVVSKNPSFISEIKNPSPELYQAALNTAFPGLTTNDISPEEFKELFPKLKAASNVDERKNIIKTFRNEALRPTQTHIEAIQILQGNAPERIMDYNPINTVAALEKSLTFGGMGLLNVRGNIDEKSGFPFLEKYNLTKDAQRYEEIISIDPNIYDITEDAEKFMDRFNIAVKTASYQELKILDRLDIIEKVKSDRYSGAAIVSIETKLNVNLGTLKGNLMGITTEIQDNKLINIGKISYYGFNGDVCEVMEYTDKEEYLNAIKKELNYNPDGFKHQTLTSDPEIRKSVDDLIYDAYGADNPHDLDWYYRSNVTKISDLKPSHNITSKNTTLCYTDTRTLSADVVLDGERKITAVSNPMITNKLTRGVSPLDTKGVDLKGLSGSQLKDLLSGQQVSGISGLAGSLGLSKTPAGWCLSIGKKIVNTADSEAGI